MRVQDFEGQTVVLLFFPAAFTGVCTREMCGINESLGDYEAVDAVVIGISGDMPWSLTKFAQQHNLTMPLASDYNHEAAKAYDIEYGAFAGLHGVTKRAEFIFDKGGILRYQIIRDNADIMPDLAELQAKVKEIASA